MDEICKDCENLEKCRNYEEKTTPCPAEPQHGRESCKWCKGTGEVDDTVHSVQAGMDIIKPCPACNKMKPLAQYLSEYIEHELADNTDNTWRELLEQALDAYESTEQVKVRIERV